MTPKTKKRVRWGAALVFAAGAFALCGAVGLWGVALAAVVLVYAPSKSAGVVLREEIVTPEAAVAEWSKADGFPG